VFLASPQKSRAICIHEQVEKSGVQELQNETAASGLWMVINGLHAMKNHAGASVGISCGPNAKVNATV